MRTWEDIEIYGWNIIASDKRAKKNMGISAFVALVEIVGEGMVWRLISMMVLCPFRIGVILGRKSVLEDFKHCLVFLAIHFESLWVY